MSMLPPTNPLTPLPELGRITAKHYKKQSLQQMSAPCQAIKLIFLGGVKHLPALPQESLSVPQVGKIHQQLS